MGLESQHKVDSMPPVGIPPISLGNVGYAFTTGNNLFPTLKAAVKKFPPLFTYTGGQPQGPSASGSSANASFDIGMNTKI